MKSNSSEDRHWDAVPADVADELLRLEARLGAIGRRMHWLDTTGSTNDIAAELAELGAPDGTVIVADTQTSGRGRHGRSWFSPAGAGLYVSVVFRPLTESPGANTESPMTLLTLASGVALAEGVRAATGLPAEIKWPNDIVIGRRKLAGILAESSPQSGGAPFIVLGFGLNLQPAAYPAELASRATSIEAESGRPADRAQIFAEILARLAARYGELHAGKFDAILSAWRHHAPSLPSAPVEWDSPRGIQRGHAMDIDSAGALLVRVGDRVERIIAGEVRWR